MLYSIIISFIRVKTIKGEKVVSFNTNGSKFLLNNEEKSHKKKEKFN